MLQPVDVLIITAMKDELDGIRLVEAGAVSPAWELMKDSEGFPLYTRRFSRTNGTEFTVAAAWSTSMGEKAAATAASRLVAQLHPYCLAMSGVCAGKRGKVYYGDVIVAERAFSYDAGKLKANVAEDGSRTEEHLHDIQTYNLHSAWKQCAELFAEDWAAKRPLSPRPRSMDWQVRWLRNALLLSGADGASKHPDRPDCCPRWQDAIERLRQLGHVTKQGLTLTKKGQKVAENERLAHPDGLPPEPAVRAHLGVMATGARVMEDSQLFERLEQIGRKTVAVEMEATGIGEVADSFQGIARAIVVKAVQDYADKDKDDQFRKFACRESAEFLIAFLREHLEEGTTGGASQQASNDQPRGDSAPVPVLPAGNRLFSLMYLAFLGRHVRESLDKLSGGSEQDAHDHARLMADLEASISVVFDGVERDEMLQQLRIISGRAPAPVDQTQYVLAIAALEAKVGSLRLRLIGQEHTVFQLGTLLGNWNQAEVDAEYKLGKPTEEKILAHIRTLTGDQSVPTNISTEFRRYRQSKSFENIYVPVRIFGMVHAILEGTQKA